MVSSKETKVPTILEANINPPNPKSKPQSPVPGARVGRLTSALRRAAFGLWHARIRSSLGRPDRVSLLGFDLVVAPGVLNPRHFRTSRVLAAYVAGLDLNNQRVADIGTGSGLAALAAARAGARVTAVDIDPVAVECASQNAARTGLAARIQVVRSNVWEAVDPTLRFDLVISNPPFYPRDAEGPQDQAFAAGADYSFFTRLADGLGHRLAAHGSLVLVHSSDVPIAEIAGRMRTVGLSLHPLRERRGFFETLSLNEFKA